MTYARTTTVPVEKTEAEIKATVRRYGADRFASFEEPGRAAITFEMRGRRVMFRMTLPAPSERRFVEHSRGRRTPAAAEKEWEQACRARWRALLLCLKAKLESVEAGIESFEDAFLAQTVLPSGETFGDHVREDLGNAIAGGGPLMLTFGDGDA